jgi:protein TonB
VPDPAPAPRQSGAIDPSALPVPTYCPAPRYPAEARREGWEGLVLVTIRIDRRGSVVSAVIAQSSGHEILDGRALSTVRRWRFHPVGPSPALDFDYPIQFRLK